MSNVEANLDTIIAEAVDARIKASVLAALSGDAVMGQYVAAALNRPVEVPRSDGGYGKDKVPFLSHVIETAMRDATKAAVADLMREEADRIKAEVAKQLRKSAPAIADRLVGALVDVAEKPYGVSVELKIPGRG